MMKISELMSLNGRFSIITGAAGSLGIAIGEALAECGSNLILVDLPSKNLSFLVEKYKKMGVEAYVENCDLENHNSRIEFLNTIKYKYESISILINNAAFVGTSTLEGWNTSFEKQSVEVWSRVLEVNLIAPFHLSQGLTNILIKSPDPTIVNIGSIYGQYGPDWRIYQGTEMGNPAAYSASKGGLLQLTRWLSTTLAPHIRVNAISPGGILRNQSKIFIKEYTQKTPLDRMATENDIKGAAVYLCSNLSKYVTGQVLFIDGGWGVW